MRRAFVFALALLLSAKEATAQRLPFTVYTTIQGLIHNRCHSVRQDGLGYLWIGTDVGIARFDGRSFKYYPSSVAPFKASPSVTVDDGWVVYGLNEYGPVRCKGDSVQYLPVKGHRFGWIVGIAKARQGGYLLSDVQTGLFHVAADGTTTRADAALGDACTKLLDLFEDSRGTLWIGSTEGLIACPNGNLAAPRRFLFFDGKYLNLVREAKNGWLYVSCVDGLFRFPRTDFTGPLPTPEMLYRMNDVTGIAFAEDGSVWCTSAPEGVTHVTGPGRHTSYGVAAGLPAVSAWDAYRDREGILWFCTENGVVKLSRTDFSLVDFSDKDVSGVKSGIAWDDSVFLLSNHQELQAWSGGRSRLVATLPSPAGFETGRLFKSPEGELWITLAGEVRPAVFRDFTVRYRFDGRRITKLGALADLPGGPEQIWFSKGTIQHGRDLWAVGGGAFLHYSGGRFERVQLRGHDGTPAEVTALCNGADSSEAWVLDREQYLIRCSLQRDASGMAVLQPVQYLPAGLLRGSRFNLIFCSSNGSLFLGGREGLGMCRPMPGGGLACAHYGKTDGATSANWITAFCEDAFGNVWLGTVNGLDKYIFDRRGNRIERGLFRAELCGGYIFFVQPLGERLMIGTTGCMGVAELRGKIALPPPPLIHLTGLRIGGDDADSLLHARGNVRLRPHQNVLTFSFLGVSFQDEHAVRYRYRLEGLDDTWNGLTPEYSVTYSNVPPGDYTFRVEAQSADGQWSAQPALFRFTVLQPFYTRWWFITLCVLATMGILYGIYRYRLAQVMAIQRIRTKISKDLHDDIGATVSSIGILASIAGKNELKEEKRHQYLDTISDQSKYVAETLSDIVWAINPSNDSLEKLFARVLRYATELFEARGIDYTADASPELLRGLSLPMDARQNLYLLIKEAVNNLVKYSGAGHASIRVTREAGQLAISITDDGRGFDPETATGNGLLNMRKRAQALHGSLRIDSKRGSGTRVQLDIPLKSSARMM